MTAATRQDIRPIHTVNARGNMLLEVVRDHSRLSPSEMLREIQSLRREIEEVLAQKDIRYEALRSALVPSQNRREIALIFDTTQIENYNYGREIFAQCMPL